MTSDEGSLPVYDHQRGSGPALVFLHYMGGSAKTWKLVTPEFPDREIIRIDFRGWARSAELDGPYDIDTYADDVLAIIRAESIEEYILVGHSMGGKVAQIVASRRPEGLRGIVLVAAAPPRPPAEVTPEYQEQISHAYDTEESIAAALENALTAVSLPSDVRRQVISDSSSASEETRLEWPLRGIRTDITDRARLIDVPALVIAGAFDQVEPEATLRENLLPFLSDVRLVTVQSGHLVPLEAPRELAEHLRDFSDGL